jgi:O-antigen/teichoic acid export membrane protein
MAGRAIWSLTDQGLSSASNIAVGIVAARNLTVEQFGGFGLAFTSYILVLGIGRGLISDPLLVRYSARPERRLNAGASVAGGVVIYGVLTGLGYLVVGLVVGGSVGWGLVGLGITMPGLLLQDSWRYISFSDARPQLAVVVDLVWSIGLAAMLVFTARRGITSAGSILWSFGASAAIAGAFGCLLFRRLPDVRGAWAWVHGNRDLGFRYATEYLTTVGATYMTVYGLGLVGGLSAVAAVRGAQLFFGPINVLFTGISLVLVPEGVRIATRSKSLFRKFLLIAAVGLTVIASVWLIIGLVLPDHVGELLLGSSWVEMRGVLLPYGIGLASGGVLGAAYVGLRAMGDAKSSLRARIRTVPLVVVIPMIGAVLADGYGYSVGFAVASILSAGLWWVIYSTSLSTWSAELPGAGEVATDPDSSR